MCVWHLFHGHYGRIFKRIMNVTMLDIANELGISRASVSLALNNSPKVAATTRDRVLVAAKRMGYKSNPYVSALMAARRKGRDPAHAPTIALITTAATEHGWREQSNQRRFVEGVQEHAKRLGLKTELFWIGDPSMTARRMNVILCSRGLKGAVLLSNGPFGDRLDYEWKDIATLTFGARELHPRTDWVSGDFYGNMEEALRNLKELGFRRIAFAMDRPFLNQCHNRWVAAYHMEQATGSIQNMETWQPCEPTFEGFFDWFQVAKPDVIICVSPPVVIAWLARLGLRVPEDIGVAAIGTAEPGGKTSGIVVDTARCGELAVEMLLDRIHGGELGACPNPQHVTVSGTWNHGETVMLD